MESDTPRAPDPKWIFWTGWTLSVLPSLMLLMSAIFKFVKPDYKPEGAPDLGWEPNLIFALGFVELGCTLIYLFPRTAVLGAILLTGYLGGAVATHARIHDPLFVPIILGVVIWCGLYLRDPRLRALVPWRNCACPPAKPPEHP